MHGAGRGWRSLLSVLAGERVALVFAAGAVDPNDGRLRARLGSLDRPYVVAADAGARTALAFGFWPHLVVGDFDSLDAATLGQLRTRQVPVESHPRDKDATDGQLAIARALQAGPTRVLLVGFLGGPRLDQLLASVLLLATLPVPAVLLDAANECQVLRAGEALGWSPVAGEVVSLLPLDEQVAGVRTYGLRWRLDGERLVLGSTRGLSNEPVAEQVGVRLERGRLLVTRHFPVGSRPSG